MKHCKTGGGGALHFASIRLSPGCRYCSVHAELDLYSPFVAIAYHTAPFDEVMAVISRARAAGARLPTVAEVLATLPTATRRYHR